MNKTFLTVLALSCSMTANVAAQEYKGSAPVSGATYNLYNVGTKQFLGIENGGVVAADFFLTRAAFPTTPARPAPTGAATACAHSGARAPAPDRRASPAG